MRFWDIDLRRLGRLRREPVTVLVVDNRPGRREHWCRQVELGGVFLAVAATTEHAETHADELGAEIVLVALDEEEHGELVAERVAETVPEALVIGVGEPGPAARGTDAVLPYEVIEGGDPVPVLERLLHRHQTTIVLPDEAHEAS